jgi:hypothetical protein
MRFVGFGVVMRYFTPIFAGTFAAITLSMTAANADTVMSCRTEATLAANEWAKDQIRPVADDAASEPEGIVVIAYGRRYVAAPTSTDGQVMRPRALGSFAKQRNEVYNEQLDRCLGHFTVKIVNSGALNFTEEDGKREVSKIKRVTQKRPGPK